MPRHGNKQKHESKNPVQRALVGRFKSQVVRMVRQHRPKTLLEVGCGEGYILEALAEADLGVALSGVDISGSAIEDAQARLGDRAVLERIDARELARDGQTFDMVLMLEVLEHIERPQEILPILQRLSHQHLILSVPWEPFFRGLNLLRGKHITAWGNDPEHINHWGRRGFLEFVGGQFDVLETPMVFPWTMALATLRE
jgi:SAM-dependent methyltransferase